MKTLVAAVVVLLGLLAASYYVSFSADRRHVRAARPAERLEVSAARGLVEVAGADGQFHVARVGDAVPLGGRVRTGDDASAELRTESGTQIRIDPASEVQALDLRRELERLALGGGMVEAQVPDDPGRVFELKLGGGDAVARTRGARLTASAAESGVAIAASRGEVALTARGREVVIHAGEQSRALTGEPPEAPVALPHSLFLKVDWPAAGAQSVSRVVVHGRTDAGARVQVEGHYVAVARDGTYQREIDLADGEHQLHVRAVDVAGHVESAESTRIVIDTRTDFRVRPPKWK